MVAMVRDIDELASDWQACRAHSKSASNREDLQDVITRGEVLAHHATRVSHTLTLSDREILRRFADVLGVDRRLATLRDLNVAAAAQLVHLDETRRADRQARQADRSAGARSKLEWLEILVAGLIAAGAVDLLTRNATVNPTLQVALLIAWRPGSHRPRSIVA